MGRDSQRDGDGRRPCPPPRAPAGRPGLIAEGLQGEPVNYTGEGASRQK